MEIDVQNNSDYQLVRLTGELRSEAMARITEELHPLIGERGAAMVVDLSEVPMIDSSGLSSLIGLATHARLSKSRVVLTGATPFVSGVFNMTQLDKWFEITETVYDAEKMLRN